MLPLEAKNMCSASIFLPYNFQKAKLIFFHLFFIFDQDGVPTRPGKPGKMGRHFPVREKSGNFHQTGKVRENHTKYLKTEGISDKHYPVHLYITRK